MQVLLPYTDIWFSWNINRRIPTCTKPVKTVDLSHMIFAYLARVYSISDENDMHGTPPNIQAVYMLCFAATTIQTRPIFIWRKMRSILDHSKT